MELPTHLLQEKESPRHDEFDVVRMGGDGKGNLKKAKAHLYDTRQTDAGIMVAVSKENRDPVDTIVKLEFDRSVADLKPVLWAGFQPTNHPPPGLREL